MKVDLKFLRYDFDLIAQEVMVLASVPAALSSVPGSHVVGGENWCPKVVL